MPSTLPLDQIVQGDAVEVMAALPAQCADLIFADPPYYLQLQQQLWRPNMTLVDAVDDEWDQFASLDAYDRFTRDWLAAARAVMKETATIWISGTYHNIFRVGTILQDLGFWVLNTVTFYKPNAMPNFRGTRLKNDVEFVIWAKRSKKDRYVFNHRAMKLFNSGKQLGSVWTIPTCNREERLKDAAGKKLHPTQKPEELLRRIILASSAPGDLILDPFAGSGTTAAVAKQLHRHWIGIEREPRYVEAARARIETVQPLAVDHPLLEAFIPEKRLRVPFRVLLDAGYLHAGQPLFLDRPLCTAEILPGGLLRVEELTGSIHRLGARLKGVPSCNGWKHWFYEDRETGQSQPIDNLRQKARETLANHEGE
jgi:DNA modification methylase